MLAASFRDISGDVAESYLSSHKPFETESSQSFDLKSFESESSPVSSSEVRVE